MSGESMNVWQFLAPFSPRGSGSVRAGELGRVSAVMVAGDLVVTVHHAVLGVYTVTFRGVVVHEVPDYEDALDADGVACFVAGSAWEFDAPFRQRDPLAGGGMLHAVRSGLFMRSLRMSFEDVSVVVSESRDTDLANDGRCRVCGSNEFWFFGHGRQRIQAVDGDAFVRLGPATIGTRHTRVACIVCETPRVMARRGTFSLNDPADDGVPNRITPDVTRDIQAELVHAHAKHGDRGMGVLSYDDTTWLPILMEEVGEVAQSLITDAEGLAELRAELVQVATTAAAWVASIDRHAAVDSD